MYHTNAYLTLICRSQSIPREQCGYCLRALLLFAREYNQVCQEMADDTFAGYWHGWEAIERILRDDMNIKVALQASLADVLRAHGEFLMACVRADRASGCDGPFGVVREVTRRGKPTIEAFYVVGSATVSGMSEHEQERFTDMLSDIVRREWPYASILVLVQKAAADQLFIHHSTTHELAEVDLVVRVQKACAKLLMERHWADAVDT